MCTRVRGFASAGATTRTVAKTTRDACLPENPNVRITNIEVLDEGHHQSRLESARGE